MQQEWHAQLLHFPAARPTLPPEGIAGRDTGSNERVATGDRAASLPPVFVFRFCGRACRPAPQPAVGWGSTVLVSARERHRTRNAASSDTWRTIGIPASNSETAARGHRSNG